MIGLSRYYPSVICLSSEISNELFYVHITLKLDKVNTNNYLMLIIVHLFISCQVITVLLVSDAWQVLKVFMAAVNVCMAVFTL